jgi:asparagine synthase (glutamine-hydrolysing)
MEMANTLEGRTPFMAKPLRELILNQPDRNMISGLKDKVLLRRSYARLFPAEFAQTPKKQFNAPFIKSNDLMEQYGTKNIFEATGIADNSVFKNLLAASQQTDKANPYLTTHLQSASQTAICLSIINSSIVENNEIQRDEPFENACLEKGGPVN